MVEPVPPGASKFALRTARAMQLATVGLRPVLLAMSAEETSPFGAILAEMVTAPCIVGSDWRPVL